AIAILAEVEIRPFDKFDGVFSVAADQAERSLGDADHFDHQLRSIVNGRFGRSYPTLDGPIDVSSGGEFSKAFVLGQQSLRYLEHSGVDGTGLQGDIKDIAGTQREKRNLLGWNFIDDKDLPRENFRQRAERCDADLFATHLLERGDVRMGK